jgi:acyl dehydratase
MLDMTLDTSDLDRWLGKRLDDSISYDPIAPNDIRRWVQAMHYPNRLHYDHEYAAQSRFAEMIAPQSFAITTDDGHGAAPACVGKIPDSHLIFGGDEWWFYGPVIKAGDRVHNERIPVDYVVKETSFAGPTCFQRGDNIYYNQAGDKIATQRSTSIRYRPDLAREKKSLTATEEPHWSDGQLAELESRKFEWIESLHDLGHGKRLWDYTTVGDSLPTRVIGPHSIASFATEWRAFTMSLWGSMRRRQDGALDDIGWTEEMDGYEQDPVMERINPELTDGAYYGPSRGHLFTRHARHVGMPRGYGYGASMGAWVIDYLAGWAGQWGMVTYCNALYRGAALVGDITIMDAEITDKTIDEQGRNIVEVKCLMTNQDGATLSTAKASIALPVK